MLVLSRFPGERIIVGEDIVIEIIDVLPGRKVRIGIDAPSEIPVHREEVQEKILAERQLLQKKEGGAG